MRIRLLQGDCRKALRTFDACSVDAIVTDPPYHLTNSGGGPHGKGLNNAFSRSRAGATSTGFMGMSWDGGDVAFQPETWVEAMRVLKPGGYLLAFSGSRTYHRLATAIDQAGFELRDMLLWIYGSGFPKGTDKAKIPPEWAGWNTALKPAHEPICMARKPMEGTLAENLRKWGTGALWIDGCRIDPEGARPLRVTDAKLEADGAVYGQGIGNGSKSAGETMLGRWPANVLHDGSDEVIAAFPEASGAVAPVTGREPTGHGFSGTVYGAPGTQGRQPSDRRDGGGSAARFFYCAKASRADRNEGCEDMPRRALNWSSGEQNPGSFQSENTDRTSPNFHPTVKPTDLMRWLCRLVTPPGGTVLDPFMGSGSTGKAAVLEGFPFTGIELDRNDKGEPIGYLDIARARIAWAQRERERIERQQFEATAQAPLFADVGVAAA